MVMDLNLNFYRYLHQGLRRRDPSLAESILIAPCSIWPLFIQRHSPTGNPSAAATNGEAMAIGEAENAASRSLEELSLALQSLDARDARYVVVPQHDPM